MIAHFRNFKDEFVRLSIVFVNAESLISDVKGCHIFELKVGAPLHRHTTLHTNTHGTSL